MKVLTGDVIAIYTQQVEVMVADDFDTSAAEDTLRAAFDLSQSQRVELEVANMRLASVQ